MLLLILQLLIQLDKLRPHRLRIRLHSKRLIVQTKAAMVRPSDLIKVPLQLHQFALFLLDFLG